MRLNPDCIRDILLALEECPGANPQLFYTHGTSNKYLDKYSHDEILYHINQCELSGLLTKVSWCLGGTCIMHDLSPLGHEFLADIRSDTNWNKTKDIAKKVGSSSLNTLKDIATGVISDLIKSQF